MTTLPPRIQEPILTVAALTAQLKDTLERRFARVAVRGEISNLSIASSGHVYFTLKDASACLQATLWRTEASRLKFRPKDGLSVIARGRLAVYEPRGQYQLICDALEPEGAGALALAFEQLKARLAAEGLFAPERKRSIPFLPRRIGVVTSASGAALQDFLRILNDRFPIPVLLVPARVQGEGAAEEIARGVERLASQPVDVIVVTRGGGSLEDLWAFNEERVARAIAASPIPVVSAVGHEVDFTIADFVADRRCATPTDAAKLLAPPRDELAAALAQRMRHLREVFRGQLSRRRERLGARAARLAAPNRRIDRGRMALDDRLDRMEKALLRRQQERHRAIIALQSRLSRAHPRTRLAAAATAFAAGERRLTIRMKERLSADRRRFATSAARLESLSPLAVLGRGYAIAFAGGHVLRTARNVVVGDPLRLLLSDQSEVDAQVLATRSGQSSESGSI